jgi:hypothetical protein
MLDSICAALGSLASQENGLLRGKTNVFLSSPAGKSGLWAMRVGGFVWLFLALYLFFGLFVPGLKLPFYLAAIPILLPLILRVILLKIISVKIWQQHSQ